MFSVHLFVIKSDYYQRWPTYEDPKVLRVQLFNQQTCAATERIL